MVEKEKKPDYLKFAFAFTKASRLSFSFAFFPVLFLLIGVLLDKMIDSVPLFIIISIVLGVMVFIYNVTRVIKEYK